MKALVEGLAPLALFIIVEVIELHAFVGDVCFVLFKRHLCLQFETKQFINNLIVILNGTLLFLLCFFIPVNFDCCRCQLLTAVLSRLCSVTDSLLLAAPAAEHYISSSQVLSSAESSFTLLLPNNFLCLLQLTSGN